jgi:hypothetical protein
LRRTASMSALILDSTRTGGNAASRIASMHGKPCYESVPSEVCLGTPDSPVNGRRRQRAGHLRPYQLQAA